MDEQELLKERFKAAVSSAVKVISEQLNLEIKFGNNKNPFDSTDIAFDGKFSIPTIVGRTNCNWSDVKQTFTCYSRWGTGTNDYEETIIDNPF